MEDEDDSISISNNVYHYEIVGSREEEELLSGDPTRKNCQLERRSKISKFFV